MFPGNERVFKPTPGFGNIGADDSRVRTDAILKMFLSSMTAVSRSPDAMEFSETTFHGTIDIEIENCILLNPP